MKKKFIRKLIAGILVILLTLANSIIALAQTYVPGEDFVYLSDLTWMSAKTDYETVQIDKGLENKPLELYQNGVAVEYEKGICAHANSEIVYNIEGKNLGRFTAMVGVNVQAGLTDNKEGSVIFKIKVDDKQIFTSPLVLQKDDGVSVNVTIPENSKTLTLIVNDGGNGISCDHGIWADAKLYTASASNQVPKNIITNTNHYELD